MEAKPNLGFAEWLTALAVAVDSDEGVRASLRGVGPIKIQFELPVKFFVVGEASQWAVGLGEVYRPMTVLETDFEAFAELLQGRFHADKVKVTGDASALAKLFGALSNMKNGGPPPIESAAWPRSSLGGLCVPFPKSVHRN